MSHITIPMKNVTSGPGVPISGSPQSSPKPITEVAATSLQAELEQANAEIKRLRESLDLVSARSREQLDEKRAELEAFTYSISHDLRAPLRIINGFTSMLAADFSEDLGGEAKRLMGLITDNVRNMGLMIEALTSYTHVGNWEMIIQCTDMDSIVKNTILEQSAISPVHVSFVTGELLPVVGDSMLLRNLWRNLVSNAIKFSAKIADPLVEIGCETSENEVTYYIKDNGVGFDMQYSQKLFTIFHRLHKKTEYEGIGAGLAIAQKIVLKHGGRLWADAHEHSGATFYFSLPDY